MAYLLCSGCVEYLFCTGHTQGGSCSADNTKGVQTMGVVKAVCTSSVKGVQKEEVASITLVPDFGIAGDAHAGAWHRQVSLLAQEPIDTFKARGAAVENGSFGENIIVEGLGDLKTYPLGTRFACGSAVLELTQIGKECHSHCAIYHTMGECIMPHEGVFTRVITGGEICAGMPISVIEQQAE